jgi:hypothetical protein
LNGAAKHDTPKSKVPKLSTPTNPLSGGLSIHRNITSACVQLRQTVQQLLGNTSPESVLSSMLTLSSVQNIIDAFNGMHEALEAITEAVISLPRTCLC